jgi:hypothetical protein
MKSGRGEWIRTSDHLNYALAAEARSEASAPSNSYRRCFVDTVVREKMAGRMVAPGDSESSR